MTETDPEKRLIGYACISTYGQMLDTQLSRAHLRRRRRSGIGRLTDPTAAAQLWLRAGSSCPIAVIARYARPAVGSVLILAQWREQTGNRSPAREAALSGERVERRLAAILAADVAGYSRLMGEDEAGTLARLQAHRRELIDPKIAEHKGRIVKTTGDGILIEFASVVDAVPARSRCSGGWPSAMPARPSTQRIEFRIGINLGDVIVEDDDIYGDGVNVAARLGGLAEPGGICVSGTCSRPGPRQARSARFEDLGEQALKNIARPVRVYRVGSAPLRTPATSPVAAVQRLPLPDKPSIAVLPFQNMSGDPEQEYFADGMVEEIITALSPHPLAVRHRPQFELHLQGPGRRCEAGRARAGRALCARRLGAQGRQPGAHHRAADRRRQPARISGPTASTARSKTCSTFRTRSRRASPASSSRRCRPPRPPARPPARPTISPPTTSICAPMRCSCRRQGKSPRRSVCWSRRSRAIRVTGRHSPGRRSAVIRLFMTTGAKIRRRTVGRASILRGGPSKWPATTRASSPMPPSRWPISARTSAP